MSDINMVLDIPVQLSELPYHVPINILQLGQGRWWARCPGR